MYRDPPKYALASPNSGGVAKSRLDPIISYLFQFTFLMVPFNNLLLLVNDEDALYLGPIAMLEELESVAGKGTDSLQLINILLRGSNNCFFLRL